MIKSLTVTNYLGDELRLELTKPELSGFIVKSITGMGPSKANINSIRYALGDGTLYNSAYLDPRSIVMNLQFYQTENESIEDVRHKSYKYFPIKRSVRIQVETDNRTSEIEGYVESNEPDIFSESEGCSITILCPDPYFYSVKKHTTAFYGIEPTFEFPFTNESLTESLLEFGLIKNKSRETVYYEGDSEVGFTMIIHSLGDASNITIYDIDAYEEMRLNTDMIAGDTIIINTRKGSKSIELVRNGIATNILNCLDKGSKWFTLSKGDNIFAFKADTGATNLQFTIESRIAYDGV